MRVLSLSAILVTLTLAVATAAPAASLAADDQGAAPVTVASQQPGAAQRVPQFSVFVDPATGYAFVRTPRGWTFRGQLSTEQLEHLPAGTYTRLIAPVSVGTGS